jgi:hypothetical protein
MFLRLPLMVLEETVEVKGRDDISSVSPIHMLDKVLYLQEISPDNPTFYFSMSKL